MKKSVERDESLSEDFRLESQSETAKITLLKRARAKYFTLGLVFGLTNLDSPFRKKYWNTYHCAGTMKKDGKKITSKYCKNRWCLVCNRIRTAVNIKKYSTELKNWDKSERYFVTLTIPNVDKNLLATAIDGMLGEFTKISRTIRDKKGFVGLRKLECTYNPIRNDYHPHFHCIIKGEENGQMLLDEWLVRYPNADRAGQDIRLGNDKDIIELFKYFTKIISTKSDKGNNGEKAPTEYRRKIYLSALDIIFQSVAGRRTFQNFGFKSAQVDEEQQEVIEVESEKTDKIEFYNWEQEMSDWLNMETGELLTGYIPSEQLTQLIKTIV